MTTHPEDQGPISPLSTGPRESPWILRHFDKPISLQEHLHKSLDRLVAEMTRMQETQGVLAITIMDSTGPWAGRTVMIALDLDPDFERDGDDG